MINVMLGVRDAWSMYTLVNWAVIGPGFWTVHYHAMISADDVLICPGPLGTNLKVICNKISLQGTKYIKIAYVRCDKCVQTSFMNIIEINLGFYHNYC